MVNELPIVGGDQRKVGYYTGITVRLISESFFSLEISNYMTDIRILRCRSGHCGPLEPPF